MKKFNGEDVSTISPTLGFNIKTLEHRGLDYYTVTHTVSTPMFVFCISSAVFIIKTL